MCVTIIKGKQYNKNNIYRRMRRLIHSLLFIHLVISSSVTFPVSAGSKECFYVQNCHIKSEIVYYFAVQHGDDHRLEIEFEIYTPGNFEEPAVRRVNQIQGEWSFEARQEGEYGFCFSCATANRIVDFDVKIQDRGLNDDSYHADIVAAERLNTYKPFETLSLLDQQLNIMENNLHYYRARSWRNQETVIAIAGRMKWCFLAGTLVMVGLSFVFQRMVFKLCSVRTKKHVA